MRAAIPRRPLRCCSRLVSSRISQAGFRQTD